MQPKKSMLVLLAAAFMLVAGSVFAQESNSPAQASTTKDKPVVVNTLRTGNQSLDKNIDWGLGLAAKVVDHALTPEVKADVEKKIDEAMKKADEKKKKMDEEVIPFLGAFGAADVNYLPIDMDVFDPMTDDRDIDNFGPLYTIGGRGGVIYKNLRFGGFGFGVSQMTEDEVAGDDRKAVLDMGGGGIFMELDTTGSRKAGLFIGSDIGAGSIALHAKGADLGPEGKFDADRAVFFAYPYLGFWLAPTDWMWLRVHGGYNYFHITTTDDDFENDLNNNMVDGSIRGNYQVGLNLCFGYIPKGE